MSERKQNSAIFWGLMLIFIGLLFILRNFDIVDFNWAYVWRLWPLMLIYAGISMLPIKEVIKLILAVLFFIGALIIIVRFGQSPEAFWL